MPKKRITPNWKSNRGQLNPSLRNGKGMAFTATMKEFTVSVAQMGQSVHGTSPVEAVWKSEGRNSTALGRPQSQLEDGYLV